MKNRDYHDDLKVDMNDLHVECSKQASVSMYYQESLAKKQTEKDNLKLQLEVYEALLDKSIRSNEKQKLTEAKIKAAIISDLKRVEKMQEIINITEEINILKSAVNSFDQKKSSLENLVKLYGQSYFSVPNTKIVNESRREKIIEKLNEKKEK